MGFGEGRPGVLPMNLQTVSTTEYALGCLGTLTALYSLLSGETLDMGQGAPRYVYMSTSHRLEGWT